MGMTNKEQTKAAQENKEVAPYGWVIGRGGKRYPLPKNESIL